MPLSAGDKDVIHSYLAKRDPQVGSSNSCCHKALSSCLGPSLPGANPRQQMLKDIFRHPDVAQKLIRDSAIRFVESVDAD